MATTTTITKLLFRRGNDSDRKQTILASGEPGWTLDTKRLWIGDGVTPGGVAALDPRTDHMHYIDTVPGDTGQRWTTTEEHDLGGAQLLDLNIPGLAHTLAGHQVQDDNQRWFHPVNREISTQYDLRFTDYDAEIIHEGTGPFKIGKSNNSVDSNNTIHIGDALHILPTGVVEIDVDNLVFNGANMVFDGASSTHFEDKSIDLNVVYTDATNNAGPLPPGQGSMSNGAGLYFSHNNYLSAGYFRIGGENNNAGMSTMEFAPTVYLPNWEARENGGFTENPTNRTPSNGQNNFTFDWIGTVNPYIDQNGGTFRSSKPLKMQSVRPQDGQYDFRSRSYNGDAHFVFESGLIVYDAGDPTTGAYNAYKLNQSVDTRAVPTFAGLLIQNEDGSPGQPIPVYSGGTGVNEFTSGSVLYTTGKHTDNSTDDDIQAMVLERGDLMVGTTDKGVVKSKLNHSDWVSFVYSDGDANGMNGRSDGVIKIQNTFAPDFLKDNKPARDAWFTRFRDFQSDNGRISPTAAETDPSELVTFKGDGTASYGGSIRTKTFDSDVNNRGMRFMHNTLASVLYSRGNGEFDLTFSREDGVKNLPAQTVFAGQTSNVGSHFDNLLPVTPEDSGTSMGDYGHDGMTIGAVSIDAGGHLVGFRSKDLDRRYPKMFDLGTGYTDWNAGRSQSPATLAESVLTVSGTSNAESYIQDADDRSDKYNAVTRVITGISFGEYGTVSSYLHHNMHDIFYDKLQVSSMVDTVDGRLDDHLSRLNNLDGTAFLRNDSTWTTSTGKFTGWYGANQVHFAGSEYSSSATPTAHNKVYAHDNDWHFKPHMQSDTSFYVPKDKHFEWRRMTLQSTKDGDDVDGDSTQQMMLLQDTNGETSFKLFTGAKARLEFSDGSLKQMLADQTTITTLDDTGVTTAKLITPTAEIETLRVGKDTTLDQTQSQILFWNDSGENTRALTFWPKITLENGFVANDREYWTINIDGVDQEIVHTGTVLDYKPSFAGHADTADLAYSSSDADKLGGILANKYLLIEDADQAYATIGHDHDDAYVAKTGDSMTGRLSVKTEITIQATNAVEGGQLTLAGAGQSTIDGSTGTAAFIDMYNPPSGGEWVGITGHVMRFHHQGGGWMALDRSGNLRVKQDIIAYQSSDKNFKDNLKPIQNALQKTKTLTGYEFDWNDKQDAHTGHDVGVVAQEVEQVLPEVVQTRDDDSKAVRYEKLVPLLIESIKELSARVEQLESQLK